MQQAKYTIENLANAFCFTAQNEFINGALCAVFVGRIKMVRLTTQKGGCSMRKMLNDGIGLAKLSIPGSFAAQFKASILDITSGETLFGENWGFLDGTIVHYPKKTPHSLQVRRLCR